MASCEKQHDHKGKTPLVEVEGNFLYHEDLLEALPVGLSKEDSASFSSHYITNWVEDVLLYNKAKGNIPNSAKIKKLVDNYRKALIMHTYEEELINQELATEINDEEISRYYESNKDLFRLDNILVKGLYVKVPLKSNDLSQVRKWYKKNTQQNIEKLEKYSLLNAVDYDYFYDRWTNLDDLAAKIPSKDILFTEQALEKNPNIEVKDTAYYYFLHIEEILGKGKQTPQEIAAEEIKEILINLKRVEFINAVKDELYRDASDDNRIIYHYLKTNE